MKILLYVFIAIVIISCAEEKPFVFPVSSSITSSVYAAGNIKSESQYSVYPKINGVLEKIYVNSGDTVLKGDPLFTIFGVSQDIDEQEAALVEEYYRESSNKEALNEAKQNILLREKKKQSDSLFYFKNKRLYAQDLLSELEFKNSEIAYENSKTSYSSAKLNYETLLKQTTFNSSQAKKKLEKARRIKNDLTVYSEIDGLVYYVGMTQGEAVSTQTEVAVVGDAERFVLEMSVDVSEVVNVKKGQKILVNLSSYPDSVFVAYVTKVNPFMDAKLRTFKVEGSFVNSPKLLYPNIDFEANIVVEEKEDVLLVPREYILNDTYLIFENYDTVKVDIGLKDFNYAEVKSGVNKKTKILKPF